MGRNFTPEVLQALDAPYRNALAPRGGLAFDGTTNTRVSATLTGQSIGTSDFSLSAIFRVPAVNPATGCGLFGLFPQNDGNGSNLFYTRLNASGTLTIQGATSGYWECALPSFISTYGGKTIHLALVRTGTTLAIYINGVSQAHTDGGTDPVGSWAIPITSTYLVVGQCAAASTSAPSVSVYSASLYNLALSAADVLEIYEGGGAVPERFKFGTQANVYASDWSAGLDGWGSDGTETGNNDGVTDGTTSYNDVLKTVFGAASISRVYGGPSHAIGKAYRVTGKVYLPNTNSNIRGIFANLDVTGASSSPIAAFPQSTANPLHNIRGTWTAFSGEFVPSNSGQQITWWGLNSVGGYSTASLNDEVNFKDYAVKRIGAVVHLPLNDGLGFQLQDASTNRLHALATTTGVSHVAPLNGPARFRFTSTSSSAGFGRAVIPALSQILKVRARALTGAPIVRLGTTTSGQEIVASNTMGTNVWKDFTIALTGGIVTAAADLFVTQDSAVTIEWDITWEPLSP